MRAIPDRSNTMNINEEIDLLYATLPHIECQRRCQKYCGIILMSKAESDRIAKRIGRAPQHTNDLSCPMLSLMGNCTIYDIRPAICRIYGLTKSLQCEFGCTPDRWLDDQEASILVRQIHKLSNPSGALTPEVGPWLK